MFQEGDEVLIRGRNGWIDGYYAWEDSDGETVRLMTPGGKLINRRSDCVKKVKQEIDTREACSLIYAIPIGNYRELDEEELSRIRSRAEWCR